MCVSLAHWLIAVCNVQKVEQREREEEAAGTQKHHSGSGDGKGKHRPKKLAMVETKPSTMGERVVPVIDAALRAKVEAAAAKKQKAKVLYCRTCSFYCSLRQRRCGLEEVGGQNVAIF